MRWLSTLILSLLLALAAGPRTDAASITSEFVDDPPLGAPMVKVYVRGEIQSGDTARLRRELARHAARHPHDIAFHFDSPGGTLVEGIRMGEAIAALPETTQSHVAARNAAPASCASACVYAYLGAQFRYLAPRARIGVHQFYMEGKSMRGGEALSLSQDLSGMIVSYLHARGVEAAFFQDIVSSTGDGIYWVPHDRLAALKVVTQDVRGQTVEYTNLRGALALRIEQDALVGLNTIRLSCGRGGMTGTAYLQPPLRPFEGDLVLQSAGTDYPALDQRPVLDGGGAGARAIGFRIPPAAARAIMRNAALGAKVIARDGGRSFGFHSDVRDPRIGEIFSSCDAVISIRNRPSSR